MRLFSIDKQPVDVMLELADRVKKTRKSKGYTQADLAERAAVSLGSLKRFEQTGEISLVSLLKIAHLLGTLEDFDQLFHQRKGIPKEVEKKFRL